MRQDVRSEESMVFMCWEPVSVEPTEELVIVKFQCHTFPRPYLTCMAIRMVVAMEFNFISLETEPIADLAT